MTEEEYKKIIKELEDSHEKAVKKIQREFAFSNKKHEKGDILKDGRVSIIVDEIKWGFKGYFNEGLPCCIYIGRVLKKDGKPRKDGLTDRVYD